MVIRGGPRRPQIGVGRLWSKDVISNTQWYSVVLSVPQIGVGRLWSEESLERLVNVGWDLADLWGEERKGRRGEHLHAERLVNVGWDLADHRLDDSSGHQWSLPFVRFTKSFSKLVLLNIQSSFQLLLLTRLHFSTLLRTQVAQWVSTIVTKVSMLLSCTMT